LSDFIGVFEKYFGEDIFDYIVIQDWHKVEVPTDLLASYKSEGKEIIENDMRQDSRIIEADVIKVGEFVRHDIEKLSKVLDSLIR
jgi:hypothetical protein